MRARDIMTERVISIGPGTSIGDAFEEMERSGIRHLPIVDGDGVLGIISDRDLARFSRDLLLNDDPVSKARVRAPVSSLMSGDPLTVAPDDDIDDVIDLMVEHKIGALPVVDPDGELVGIISTIDVLRAARGNL